MEILLALSSAAAKYGRGESHRQALLRNGLAWLKGTLNGAPVPIQKSTRSWQGGEVITYSIAPFSATPPAELGLILWDALGIYRASLDHLAWELANQDRQPQRPKQIYFPICESREKFQSESVRKLAGVHPTYVSMIERFQPYLNGAQSGRHPLLTLERLVQADKHRSLRLLAAASTSFQVDIPASYGNFEVWHQERHPERVEAPSLQAGMQFFRVYGRRHNPSEEHDVQIRVHGMKMTLTDEEGWPIEGLLDQMHRSVGAILTDFEQVVPN